MNIKKKISEILESERKSHKFNSNLQREHSLSLSYPEGKTAYFKQRIFELKQQIADETLIGRAWCKNWYNYETIDINWVQKHTEILLKPEFKMNENEVWEQLQRFFRQFLQLLDYEFIIKENELKPNNEPNAAAWAFYYFILYKINSPERIEDYPEGKIKAYKKIAKDNGVNSWKNIQMGYLKLHTSRQADFLTVGKIPTIKKAIEFLKDNPEGMELAKEYLNIAMKNK